MDKRFTVSILLFELICTNLLGLFKCGTANLHYYSLDDPVSRSNADLLKSLRDLPRPSLQKSFNQPQQFTPFLQSSLALFHLKSGTEEPQNDSIQQNDCIDICVDTLSSNLHSILTDIPSTKQESESIQLHLDETEYPEHDSRTKRVKFRRPLVIGKTNRRQGSHQVRYISGDPSFDSVIQSFKRCLSLMCTPEKYPTAADTDPQRTETIRKRRQSFSQSTDRASMLARKAYQPSNRLERRNLKYSNNQYPLNQIMKSYDIYSLSSMMSPTSVKRKRHLQSITGGLTEAKLKSNRIRSEDSYLSHRQPRFKLKRNTEREMGNGDTLSKSSMRPPPYMKSKYDGDLSNTLASHLSHQGRSSSSAIGHSSPGKRVYTDSTNACIAVNCAGTRMDSPGYILCRRRCL